ncbi:MAG: helical backbone metal receptor [Bacteroidia bacterium]
MGFRGKFVDHLGREVPLSHPPQRVISLCPSQTETLVDMGLGARLVGRTRFCIHPKAPLSKVQRIGGTKEVDFDRIRGLRPDLIIGEKEENTPEMIAELEGICPVYVTDVRDIDSALRMILDLGEIVDLPAAARAIATQVTASLEGIQPLPRPVSCLYMIWKNPWMAAGTDTFINSVLKKCGFDNLALAESGRYRVLDEEIFQQKKPEIVLLSSEPFPFKSTHIADLQKILPDSRIVLVDGEMFSWYGSHLVGVENYINLLLYDKAAGLSLPELV